MADASDYQKEVIQKELRFLETQIEDNFVRHHKMITELRAEVAMLKKGQS